MTKSVTHSKFKLSEPAISAYCETHHILTKDNLRVALHEMKGSVDATRCLIVVPGFAQSSRSENFLLLCKDLVTPERNVFCLDMRGTGKSEGRYSFGGREHYDVLAALDFARSRFDNVEILGFSLGAYSTLRAAAETGEYADRLFLVSCPTSVAEILFKGSMVRHLLSVFKNPGKFKDDGGYVFRWGNPLSRKPNAAKIALKAALPVHFLSGRSDLLIPPKMSKKVFNSAGVEEKSWSELHAGLHADLMYVENPDAFKHWIENPDEY